MDLKRNATKTFSFFFCLFSVLHSLNASIPETDSLVQGKEDTTVFIFREIVVVANRSNQNQYTIPDAITILNAGTLETANVRSTPELLTGKTGVWVQKTNHGGGSPYIRGLTGYHTLLLIDGIRLNNSIFRSGPNQYLNTVDPLMLSSVEVLRGDGSVEYGSDAIGGTVNLISYKPAFSGDKMHLKGQLGFKYVSQCLCSSNSTCKEKFFPGMENILHAKAEASGKKIGLVVGGALKLFGDIEPGGKISSHDPSGYNEYDMAAMLRYRPWSNQLFTFAIQQVRQKEVPVYHKISSSDYYRYHITLQNREMYRISSETYMKGLIGKIALNGFMIRGNENLEIQQSMESNRTLNIDNIITKGLTVDVQAGRKKLMLNSGMDFYHDHVKSGKSVFNSSSEEVDYKRGTFADGSSAFTTSLFFLGKAVFGTSRFNAGVRIAYSSTEVSDSLFGQVKLNSPGIVWNIGFNQSITPWLNWVGSVNRGFRTPNISDLSGFGITDYRFEIPNLNLENEKSLTTETGFKISTPKLGATGFIYYTKLANLITIQTASYQGSDSVSTDGMRYLYYYKKTNAQESYVTGVEFDFCYRVLKPLMANFMACYTFGQNISADEPLSRIPPLNGSVSLTYYMKKQIRASMEWLVAGKQDRLSAGDKKDIRIPEGGTTSWNCFNLNINMTLKGFRINGGVNNLFNKNYRTHGSGVDAYGRNLWLSVTVMMVNRGRTKLK